MNLPLLLLAYAAFRWMEFLLGGHALLSYFFTVPLSSVMRKACCSWNCVKIRLDMLFNVRSINVCSSYWSKLLMIFGMDFWVRCIKPLVYAFCPICVEFLITFVNFFLTGVCFWALKSATSTQHSQFVHSVSSVCSDLWNLYIFLYSYGTVLRLAPSILCSSFHRRSEVVSSAESSFSCFPFFSRSNSWRRGLWYFLGEPLVLLLNLQL